jgi:hypothetical protein
MGPAAPLAQDHHPPHDTDAVAIEPMTTPTNALARLS